MRMEHSENFKAVLEEKTREAESIIAAYLPKEEGFAKELAKAMNYSMTAGGKRLRPLLLQESFRLFGGTGEAVKPFMAAMEMIHTHSTMISLRSTTTITAAAEKRPMSSSGRPSACWQETPF